MLYPLSYRRFRLIIAITRLFVKKKRRKREALLMQRLSVPI